MGEGICDHHGARRDSQGTSRCPSSGANFGVKFDCHRLRAREGGEKRQNIALRQQLWCETTSEVGNDITIFVADDLAFHSPDEAEAAYGRSGCQFESV